MRAQDPRCQAVDVGLYTPKFSVTARSARAANFSNGRPFNPEISAPSDQLQTIELNSVRSSRQFRASIQQKVKARDRYEPLDADKVCQKC